MKVQFCTSVGGLTHSYIEGQTLELPDPVPEPFFGWLRHGIVRVVKDFSSEAAVDHAAVEQAIARRTPVRRGRGRRKAVATAQTADGEP